MERGNLMENLPELISSDNKNIKRILRKQGPDICRGRIYKSTLDSAIEKFDYGFVYMVQKAQLGQSLLKVENRYNVNGFLLMEGLGEYELRIHLICVTESSKGLGMLLMQQAIQFAKENDYANITLYSLPESSLVNWYQQFGFTIINEIMKGGEIKVYLMSMNITT